MNINALKAYLTRDTEGKIDFTASVDKLYEELVEYEQSHEVVAKATQAVFDRYRGTKINKPGMVTFIMGEMTITPDNYADMREAILLYLDSNTGTKDSGALFGSVKGHGGGQFRWSDQK